jgi:tetratricopeptide (TPR) repeat protein
VRRELEDRYCALLVGRPGADRDRALLRHTDELLQRHPSVVDRLDVAELWYERAQAHARLGEHDAAIAAMETALENGWDPIPDGRCDLATLLVGAGRVEEAYALHAAVRRV